MQPHGLQQHADVLEENGFALRARQCRVSGAGRTVGRFEGDGHAKLKERKDMLKAFQAYAASCAD